MSETIVQRTKAALARRGIAPMHLDPYDDPERGWINPMDDPEVKAELRALIGRLWANPIDPYGSEPHNATEAGES